VTCRILPHGFFHDTQRALGVVCCANHVESTLGGGVGALAGGGGTPTGYSGNALTGLWHGGGMVNEPSGSRYAHPAYFENAPRFHASIGPDELAAVIRKDERPHAWPDGRGASGRRSDGWRRE
jgi:hypothetical protein